MAGRRQEKSGELGNSPARRGCFVDLGAFYDAVAPTSSLGSFFCQVRLLLAAEPLVHLKDSFQFSLHCKEIIASSRD